MNTPFLTPILSLITAAAVLVGCKKDKTSSSEAVQKKPEQEYQLSCGTSDDSNDGFIMDVKITSDGEDIDKGKRTANVDTRYLPTTKSPQKVMMHFGDLNIHDVLLKEKRVLNVGIFQNMVVQMITLPNDGKRYWFVPFDPKDTPRLAVKTAGGDGAIGCCCGDRTDDACYVSDAGQCTTKVCAKCSNTAIAFDDSGLPSIRSKDKGFALVRADILQFNGTIYK